MKSKLALFIVTCIIASQSYAQLRVTTGTKKYVLLEEATGTWCGYCPDGAQDIEQNIEPNFPRCIVASWHGPDGYDDPMMVPGDPFTGSTGYFSGYPMAAIDRSSTFGGGVGQDRPWDGQIAADTGLTPKFQVDMTCTYDVASRLLTVAITGKALTALTGTWHISGLVLEDSIPSGKSSAYNQDNYAGPPINAYTTSCTGSPSWFVGYGDPIMPTTRYAHMNVVRAILVTDTTTANDYGLWGDTAFVNPASGTTFTKTYTYTVDTGYVANRMRVVGLVQNYGVTIFDREIENCISSKLKLMPNNTLGAARPAYAMMDVQLYPNPAKNNIMIKGMLEEPSSTKVIIYNAIGQAVMEKDYEAAGSYFSQNIDLSKMSTGVYFMSIMNNEEKVIKKFEIKK